jgi:hypothetical protein
MSCGRPLTLLKKKGVAPYFFGFMVVSNLHGEIMFD